LRAFDMPRKGSQHSSLEIWADSARGESVPVKSLKYL
jgi:hypothetical protein